MNRSIREYQGADCWKKSGFSKNLTVNKRHESLKSINYPDLTPMSLKEDNEKYILHKLEIAQKSLPCSKLM